jgi:hypothetical protein
MNTTFSYKRGIIHIDSNALSELIVAKNECGESKQFGSVRAAKEWLRRYNGHKNWAHWNVSLWINNTGLYRMAQLWTTPGCGLTLDQQAAGMLREINEKGITKTPDGAPYTVSSIKAALRHFPV